MAAPECVLPADKKAFADETKEKLTTHISQQYGLSREVVRSVLGAGVGNLVDDAIFEDEDTFPYFTVLGAALGTKRVRTALKNGYRKYVPKKEGVLPELTSSIEADTLLRKNHDVNGIFGVDPRDKEAVDGLTRVWEGLKRMRTMGRAIENIAKEGAKNDYFQVMFSAMRDLKVKSMQPFTKFLEGFQLKSAQMASTAVRNFNEKYGEEAYTRYLTEELPDQIQTLIYEMRGSYPTRDGAIRAANELISLVTYSGGRVSSVNGKFAYMSTKYKNVAQHYEKFPEYLDVVKRLMEGETEEAIKFRDFIQSKRDFFNNYTQEYIAGMNTVISRYMGRFEKLRPDLAPALDDFVMEHNGRTLKQYIEDLEELNDIEAIAALKEAKKDEIGRDIIDQVHATIKFKQYEENYLPQLYSRDKAMRYQKMWEEDWENTEEGREAIKASMERTGGQPDMEMAKEEAWENFVIREIEAVNANSSAGNVVREFDEEGQMVGRKNFKNREEAVRWLDRNRKHIGGGTDEDIDYIYQNIDRYLVEEKIPITRNGKQLLDADGNPKFRTKTHLRIPTDEQVTFNVRQQSPAARAFRKMNAENYRRYYTQINLAAKVPLSNHLDRPRDILLPVWMMETNIDTISNVYSRDAGRRIHNLQHGIYKSSDVYERFINPITAELKTKTADTDFIQRTNKKLQEYYELTNGTYGLNIDEVDQTLGWKRFYNTIRNLAYGAYAYGMGMYNATEWALQGMLIGEVKGLGGTAKLFFSDNDAGRMWMRTLDELNIIRGKLNQIAPEYNTITDTMDGNRFFKTVEDATGQFADKMSDFSISKGLMYATRMLTGRNIRVSQTGAWRVFLDGFAGGNQAGTGFVVRAAHQRARRLHDALVEMGDRGFARIDGTMMNRGEILRQLDLLGVSDSEVDDFIKYYKYYDDIFRDLDKAQGVSWSELVKTAEGKKAVDIFTKISKTTAETMHGTNPLYRQAASLKPMTGMLYQFKNFVSNLAFQNWQRRIKFPIEDFNNKFMLNGNGDVLPKFKGIKMLESYWHFKQGNFASLKKMGWTDEMIAEMPVDALEHFLKAATVITGMGAVSTWTVDTMKDLLALPFDYGTDDEFKRVKRNIEGFNEFDGYIEDGDLLRMFFYFAGAMAQTGAFGGYGDLFNEFNNGIVDFVPAISQVDKTTRWIMSLRDNDLEELPNEIANTVGQVTIGQIGFVNNIIGGAADRMVKENLKKRNVRFRVKGTNDFINIDNSFTNFNTNFTPDFGF